MSQDYNCMTPPNHDSKNSSISMSILLLSSLILFRCDPPGDDRLWYYNSSKDTLYFYKSYNETLPEKSPLEPYGYILPRKHLHRPLGTGKYDVDIIGSSPDSSMTLYSFLKKDVEGQPWSVILEQKRYRKAKFPLRKIEQLNWHLTLP